MNSNDTLTIELDNLVIDKEIAINVGGGITLKLNGSVIFDGVDVLYDESNKNLCIAAN